MAKTLSTGSEWIWLDTASPGVSETNVSVGNLWLNTVTNNVFICKDATIGAQVWDEYPTATVGVSKGGTGQTTLSSGEVLLGNGTSGITSIAYSNSGAASSIVATDGASKITATSYLVGTLTITSGVGAPGTTQPLGSLYLRTDGSGVNDRAYISLGGGSWTAIVTVA